MGKARVVDYERHGVISQISKKFFFRPKCLIANPGMHTVRSDQEIAFPPGPVTKIDLHCMVSLRNRNNGCPETYGNFSPDPLIQHRLQAPPHKIKMAVLKNAPAKRFIT